MYNIVEIGYQIPVARDVEPDAGPGLERDWGHDQPDRHRAWSSCTRTVAHAKAGRLLAAGDGAPPSAPACSASCQLPVLRHPTLRFQGRAARPRSAAAPPSAYDLRACSPRSLSCRPPPNGEEQDRALRCAAAQQATAAAQAPQDQRRPLHHTTLQHVHQHQQRRRLRRPCSRAGVA